MVAAGGNRVNDATLRLGTRRSPMAMAQSAHVAGLVTARTGHQVELVGLTTFGDVSQADLAQIGGTGAFVHALRKRPVGRATAVPLPSVHLPPPPPPTP